MNYKWDVSKLTSFTKSCGCTNTDYCLYHMGYYKGYDDYPKGKLSELEKNIKDLRTAITDLRYATIMFVLWVTLMLIYFI